MLVIVFWIGDLSRIQVEKPQHHRDRTLPLEERLNFYFHASSMGTIGGLSRGGRMVSTGIGWMQMGQGRSRQDGRPSSKLWLEEQLVHWLKSWPQISGKKIIYKK